MGFYLLNPHGAEINTKSRGHCWRLRLGGDVSNACRKTSFPPGHRRHHHRHAVHDASNDHGKKAAVGGKKKSGWRRYKNSCLGEAPPQPSPRGGSPFLLCFRRFGGTPAPWGGLGRGPSLNALPWEGWGGAFGLGRGLSVVLTLNTIIPASTWTDGNDLWINYEKCIDAAMLNSISGGCLFHRNARSPMYQLRCYLHLYKSCNT